MKFLLNFRSPFDFFEFLSAPLFKLDAKIPHKIELKLNIQIN